MNLSIHPVADMMPSLSESEMESLKAGIKRDGQLVPIMVLEADGKQQIIDGRHRYFACKEIGIEPVTAPWRGPTDPEGLIECAIAINVHRRHMTISQRAAIAAESLPYFEEQAKVRMLSTLAQNTGKEKIPERECGQSRDKAAAMFAVNPRYVSYAKAILEWDNEVFVSLKSGNTTLQDAARMMRDAMPKDKPDTP